MSAREWKPGDVADLHGTRVVRHSRLDGFWTFPDGSTGRDHDGDARPLVVIDPEDRQQVADLVELLIDNGWRCTTAHGLRDALRELANPKIPKPAEPTGLGAVVEDAAGMKWILVYDHSMWQQHHDRTIWRLFDQIDVVRVLSEGVTA